MIQCKFCPEQFEYEEDYEAHMRIKHPDEYQRQLASKEIEAYFTPLFSKIMATTLSSTATDLTRIALELGWEPKVVVNYYRDVFALLQEQDTAKIGKRVQVHQVATVPRSMTSIPEARDYLKSRGITEEEIKTHEKLLELLWEWMKESGDKHIP
jgi:hypothetical protein